jgi:cytochrome c-type biogenesis protein CcmH/NrfG
VEKQKIFTKVFLIVAGIAFLTSSLLGIGGLMGSSPSKTAQTKNDPQSQNAQLKLEENGFLAVLQREPNNQTALKGLIQIRMSTGDVTGTKTALEQLVKLNPTNQQYQEFLTALNKQIADTKKVGTLKPTEPKQPTPTSK